MVDAGGTEEVKIRLLAAKYRPYGVYKDARSILVIHNLAHQGVESAATYQNLGLPPQWYGALERVFPNWGYSWEITTSEGGYGLDELRSSRKYVLNGITNGIDTAEWDPNKDEYIASPYSVMDLSGKAEGTMQDCFAKRTRPPCFARLPVDRFYW